MGMTAAKKGAMRDIVAAALARRLASYNPEPAVMPFHARLLGKDRLALYAFIHSLNTNFGSSIFEPAAVAVAKEKFAKTGCQTTVGGHVSEQAQFEIQKIMDELTTGDRAPDKTRELERIRRVCRGGKTRQVKPTKADIFLQGHDGALYYIDLKTAKPNRGNFKEFKRTLMEWSAAVLHEKPKAKVNALIAIPYNPYEPKPYARWTMAGMLDTRKELKVEKEFWDFLGGDGAYEDLLDCFESVGKKMRREIDDYFANFGKRR